MDLYIDNSSNRKKPQRMHAHKNIEIIFYLEGTGRLCTRNGEFPFASGQAIIVPPGMSHCSVSDTLFRSVYVSGNFSHLIVTDVPIILWDNAQQDGEHLARLIYRSRHEDSQFLADLASAYVRFLLKRADMAGATQAAVTQVYHQMAEHAFERDLDVTQILEESGYAQDYIRMLFKKRYGMPPVKFLAKMRIEHACFLLSSYKDSISLAEIAEMVGYDDYVYFSKTFKSFTGTSPREYLKNLPA